MSSKGSKVHKIAANEPMGFGSQVGSAKKHSSRHHRRDKKKKEKKVEAPAISESSESSFSQQEEASRSGSDGSSMSSSGSLSGSESDASIGSAGHHRGGTGKHHFQYRNGAREERSATSAPMVPLVGSHQPVEALFSEAHPWKTSIMTITVNGSLEELDAKKIENGAVLRILGDGIRMEHVTPSVRERLTANASLASQSDVQKKPLAYMKARDIVREVRVVGAHNGFPCTLHFRIPNLVASAGQHSFTAADGTATNETCFTLQPGEKPDSHTVFKNDVRPEDVKLLSDYRSFTPQNLSDGVTNIGSRDGINYVSIPYTEEARHPVVDLARRKIPQEDMTKEQREKYGNGIPPELLSQSRDWPDRRIMSAQLWEKYRDRTAKGMLESNPHSDVAHPVALVSRVIDAPVYSKGGMASSKSGKYDKVTSQGHWLHSAQIYADRSTPEAKASVTSTPRQAWVKLEIRSAEIETLGTNAASTL